MKSKYIIFDPDSNNGLQSNDNEVVNDFNSICMTEVISGFTHKITDEQAMELGLYPDAINEETTSFIFDNYAIGDPLEYFSEFGYKFVDQLSSGAYYFAKED